MISKRSCLNDFLLKSNAKIENTKPNIEIMLLIVELLIVPLMGQKKYRTRNKTMLPAHILPNHQ